MASSNHTSLPTPCSAQRAQISRPAGAFAWRNVGGSHATRVAPANGIWSTGASRTGADGFGAWIIWPLPT